MIRKRYDVWKYNDLGGEYIGTRNKFELKQLAKEKDLEFCEAFKPGDFEICTPTTINTEESLIVYECNLIN